MSARGMQVYKKVYVSSAPPQRALQDLLARLAVDIQSGALAIERKDVREKARVLDHAIAILDELECALDPAVDPALCNNLASLWSYVRREVIRASVELNTAPLHNASRIVEEMRAAFQAATAVV